MDDDASRREADAARSLAKHGLDAALLGRAMTALLGYHERGVAASAWMHLACVNLFVARHAAMKARRGRWALAHTLARACVFGPAGLAAHFATAAFGRRGGRPRGGAAAYGEAYGAGYGRAYGGEPVDAPARRHRAAKHKFALMSSLL